MRHTPEHHAQAMEEQARRSEAVFNLLVEEGRLDHDTADLIHRTMTGYYKALNAMVDDMAAELDQRPVPVMVSHYNFYWEDLNREQ